MNADQLDANEVAVSAASAIANQVKLTQGFARIDPERDCEITCAELANGFAEIDERPVAAIELNSLVAEVAWRYPLGSGAQGSVDIAE